MFSIRLGIEMPKYRSVSLPKLNTRTRSHRTLERYAKYLGAVKFDVFDECRVPANRKKGPGERKKAMGTKTTGKIIRGG